MNEKKKTVEYWGLNAARFYERAEGEPVTLHLMDGRALAGEIMGVDKYNLAVLLDGGGKQPVLVFKHAVAYVEIGESE